MEPIQKGKQANKTSNMCASVKGKQTNKQVEVACVEAWMQGVVVTTCASESGSGMWRNPTGDDQVSSAHKRGSGAKVVSSTTALAHRFPPPSLSGCESS